MWIGLLYFFNFVNVAAVKEATAAGEAGPISKYVVPQALFWFRWGAVVTWIFGAALLEHVSGAGRHQRFRRRVRPAGRMAPIGFGAWLGTIMLLNVWGMIWPNQKKILGFRSGDRRAEGESAPPRVPRVAHEHDALDSDALLHGDRPDDGRPGDLPLGSATARERFCRRARSIRGERVRRRRVRMERPSRSPARSDRAPGAAARFAPRAACAIAAFSCALRGRRLEAMIVARLAKSAPKSISTIRPRGIARCRRSDRRGASASRSRAT